MVFVKVAKYETIMKELAKERQEQHLWTARFESRLAQADFKLHQQQGMLDSALYLCKYSAHQCLIFQAYHGFSWPI